MPSPELFLVRTVSNQGKWRDQWVDLKSGLLLTIAQGEENQRYVLAEGRNGWSAIIYHSDQYDKCQSFIESLSRMVCVGPELDELRRKVEKENRSVSDVPNVCGGISQLEGDQK